MIQKYLYINTMGCQMNVYDSHQIQNRLAGMGYLPTEDLCAADIIIVNTCTIRAKAEQKAFSFLGRLASMKAQNPELIVAVGGCVAQQEGKAILQRMPHVDLVFGTHAIPRLPQIIRRITATRSRVVDVAISESIGPGDYEVGICPQSEVSAFVTIMRGCDNYCSYCIVPYVRGREASRPEQDILAEIRQMVSQGIREITLLGQNVNSYGQKEGRCSFAELLAQANAIEGLERIRFTTSHPKDLSPDLMHAFSTLEKVCNHIHLPVQCGSDSILDRMNRRYTRGDYLKKVAQLRRICPDVAISTDIIVGFPGETAADFEATLDLIRLVEFDNLFAFIYSDRPHAPSGHFGGKIGQSLKKERLQAVLECQETYTQKKSRALVGTTQQVLVDGRSKNQADGSAAFQGLTGCSSIQWSGRTKSHRIVHFEQTDDSPFRNEVLTGRLMDIMIGKVMPHCLWGRPMDESAGSSGKGDQNYAT